MSKSISRLPLFPRRQDFDSEAEYYYAKEHWDEFFIEAEDIAMERHYEKKYSHENH